MSFTEEYHRTFALEAALEWMLFQLVATSEEPGKVLSDFNDHMEHRKAQLKKAQTLALEQGKPEAYVNLIDQIDAVENVRESLMSSVKLGS